MSPLQGKPTGVSLGKKSQTKHSGHVVHKAGIHSETDYATAEKAEVKRPAHKAPSSLSKKGGK